MKKEKITKEQLVKEVEKLRREITKIKEKTEHTSEKKELYHLLLDISPNAVVETGLDGKILFCNHLAAKMHGYESPTDLIGQDSLQLMHEEDIYIAQKNAELLLNKGYFKNMPYRMRKKDGTSIPVEVSACLLKDDEGAPKSFIGYIKDITESKNQQMELAERVRFIESLINLSPDIIYIFDLVDKKNVYSNNGIQTVLGYSVEEAQKMGSDIIPILMHPDDLKVYLDETIPRYSKAQDNELISHQYRMQHKNGNWHWLESEELIYKRQPDGSPHQIFGVVHDITKSKEAEKKLMDSEQKFKAIYDNANDGLLVAGIEDRKFLTGNRTICNMLGYSLDEIENMSVMDIHPEEHLPYVIDQFEKHVRKEIITAKDIPVIRKDGTVFYADVNSSPITLQNKEYLVGIFRDITERREAEEKIRRKAEEQIALLKISQGLATTLDLENVLQITINEAVKLTGLGTGAIYLLDGERLHLWATTPPLPPNFPEDLRSVPIAEHPHIKQAITTQSPVILDDTASADLTPAEQAVIQLRGLRTLLYMPLILENEVLGVFIVSSIKDRVVILGDMIQLSLTLANQSALAIKNAQLYKNIQRSYKELTFKNKELEELLYVTSHDLRSPLVNIDGYSKELDYSIKDLMSFIDNMHIPSDIKEKITSTVHNDIPESLHYIHSSTMKMGTLIKGILTLSRMGRSKLTLNKINMNEMITDIIDNHRFRLDELKIKTEVSTLPDCTGDSLQINQLFSNLLDNAIKYSDSERSSVIKISGYRDNDQSVYCIEDNGIGIEPEHQEKIFDIFHQLEPWRVKGEGMGLTIAHRIIEKHEGKIWVESELGKGSKFFVSLHS